MDTRFDLGDFSEGRRGQEWARALPAIFPFVRLTDSPSRPESGSIQGSAFAGGRLWRLHTPVQALRNAAANDGVRDNLFSVILAQDGLIGLRQETRHCEIAPDSFGLIDGNRDFEITSQTASRHLLLQMPRAVVAGRFPRLIDQSGKVFATGAGGGELLRTLIVRVAKVMSDLTPAEQAAALSSILSLLDAAVAPRTLDGRVESALAEIERSFRRPGLSAAAVAATQGVSRRRLDQLFQSALGEPVTARIWARRLQEAADLLRADADRGITELALSLGFEDSGHFARAFRRRHGVSPRQWRAARP